MIVIAPDLVADAQPGDNFECPRCGDVLTYSVAYGWYNKDFSQCEYGSHDDHITTLTTRIS